MGKQRVKNEKIPVNKVDKELSDNTKTSSPINKNIKNASIKKRRLKKEINKPYLLSSPLLINNIKRNKSEEIIIFNWFQYIQVNYSIFNIYNKHQCFNDHQHHHHHNDNSINNEYKSCIIKPFNYADNFYGCIKCGKFHICELKINSCVIIYNENDNQRTCQYSGKLLLDQDNFAVANFAEAKRIADESKYNLNSSISCKNNYANRSLKKYKERRSTKVTSDKENNELLENMKPLKKNYINNIPIKNTSLTGSDINESLSLSKRKKRDSINHKNELIKLFQTEYNDNIVISLTHNSIIPLKCNDYEKGDKTEDQAMRIKEERSKENDYKNIISDMYDISIDSIEEEEEEEEEDTDYNKHEKIEKNNKNDRDLFDIDRIKVDRSGYKEVFDSNDDNKEDEDEKDEEESEKGEEEEEDIEENELNEEYIDDMNKDILYSNMKKRGYRKESDYEIEQEEEEEDVEIEDEVEEDCNDDDDSEDLIRSLKKELLIMQKEENEDEEDKNECYYDNNEENEEDIETEMNLDNDEHINDMNEKTINCGYDDGRYTKNYFNNILYWNEYYSFLNYLFKSKKRRIKNIDDSDNNKTQEEYCENKKTEEYEEHNPFSVYQREISIENNEFCIPSSNNNYINNDYISNLLLNDNNNNNNNNNNNKLENINFFIKNQTEESEEKSGENIINHKFKVSLLSENVINKIKEETRRIIKIILNLHREYNHFNNILKNKYSTTREEENFKRDSNKFEYVLSKLTNYFVPIINRITILIYQSPELNKLSISRSNKNKKQQKSTQLSRISVQTIDIDSVKNIQKNNHYHEYTLCPKKICLSLLLQLFIEPFSLYDSMGYRIDIWYKDPWLSSISKKDLLQYIIGDFHYYDDKSIKSTNGDNGGGSNNNNNNNTQEHLQSFFFFLSSSVHNKKLTEKLIYRKELNDNSTLIQECLSFYSFSPLWLRRMIFKNDEY